MPDIKPNQEDVAESSNEESTSDITDPSKLDDSKEETLTKWKNEPEITDLKEDLEFARQENTDQKANVAGWLALRDTLGSSPGRSPKKLDDHLFNLR